MIDEREFELVNIIGSEIVSNQRDLSHHVNLSLGQTNMLLRRLIAKGYIRIRKIDKRRVKYLLTPQGLAEKMNKSIKYTLRTINSISLIKERLKDLLREIYEKGERKFIVIGKSDLAMMIDIAVKEMNLKDYSLEHFEVIPQEKMDGLFLICKENVIIDKSITNQVVDCIHELAKEHGLQEDGESSVF
ncbi:MAG: winged helix-turn-helix transcriptional regulator [Candidatus Omnitrophica bacterium]|nr:winged helix-turn-helix transcriptional regulator [Candidatus Omnitrophota bacterium]